MPVCQSCDKKWSWKEALKASFTFDTSINCPFCDAKQYPTAKSRRKFALCLFLPISSLLLGLFNVSGYVIIGVFIVGFILIFCIYPYILELSNEEEWPV